MSLNDHLTAVISARNLTDIERCAKTLARYGEEGKNALLQLLTSPDSRIVSNAVYVLHEAGWLDAGMLTHIYIHVLKRRIEVNLRLTVLCLLLDYGVNGVQEANALLEAYSDTGRLEAHEVAQAMALIDHTATGG